MVSRENRVIAACIVLAVLLLFALNAVTDPPSWATLAVLLGVGVLVPTLVNEYLGRREA
ncbi:hypothetical protein GCM10027435_17920 [Haloparvum alkalitolerans]|uniref:hypothetical protein n=1 Tax=Haloparvum alkalitolerans TaxID=1042953 RepID=UPI003CF06D2C